MRKPGFIQRGLALLCMLAGCSSPQKQAPEPVAHNERWVAYYDKNLPVEAFLNYDLVVFESSRHVDFSMLQPRTTVLGYLSIGEVHGHSELLPALKDDKAIIRHNPMWDSYVVDVRKDSWRDSLLNDQIPAILAKGFDGLMLDTIDSALATESTSDVRYFGIHTASAQLIHEIRQKFPNIKIMLNRGFPLLHEISSDIDYVLAESVQSHYDAIRNVHKITPASAHNPLFETMRLARARNPHLKIYTLDYWNMNDVKAVKTIYQEQRSRGFIPHVTTPDLRTFYDELRLGTPDQLEKPRG